jgi:hypothetical protein
MSIVLQSSSGGSVTINEPATASNFTQTLPTTNGTLATIEQIANGFRNRIINGDMRIDQRNAGASVTPTTDNTYTLDRWIASVSASSKYSVQRNAGSVTPPLGFTNYFGVTSLAATTLASLDYYQIMQQIEGFNTADLGWGTANAKTITLSFWVRSSLTGTFGGSLNNGAENRSYPYSYTISAANTWEYKTITVPGDTTGTWNTSNGKGVTVRFSLGMGSTYSGTAGAWASGIFASATGATSVVGTNGATFYITGVQLEVGSIATPFDPRAYGTELALCQRYYQTSYPSGVAVNAATGPTEGASFICINTSDSTNGGLLPVTMRATPTFAMYSTVGGAGSPSARDNASGASVTGITLVGGITTSLPRLSKSAGLSILGTPYSAHYTASAEL